MERIKWRSRAKNRFLHIIFAKKFLAYKFWPTNFGIIFKLFLSLRKKIQNSQRLFLDAK